MTTSTTQLACSRLLSLAFGILMVTSTPSAIAQIGGTPADSAPKKIEKVDLNKITDKVAGKGEDTQVGVVQSRKYTKSGRLEIALQGVNVNADPFLINSGVGGSLGFHFSEYMGLRVLAWKDLIGRSSAYNAFHDQTGADVNTNDPKLFVGGELNLSPIYGKLSLMGSTIMYFDIQLSGGAGMRMTETGNYISPLLGVGEQLFITDWLSLRLDYRFMYFRETIKEKTIPSLKGKTILTRNNFSHTILAGITFLIF